MKRRSSHSLGSSIVAVWLLLYGAPHATATDFTNILTGYSIASWGEKDGLSSSVVWAMVQSGDGYLWLGTDDGLVRFDGLRFTAWPIASDQSSSRSIRALSVARAGGLWVGFAESGGVSLVTGTTVRRYDRGLPPGPVFMLFEDPEGTVWTGSRDGLFRLAGEQWERIADGLSAEAVYAAFIDSQGAFFVGTASGAYRRAPGEATFSKLYPVGPVRSIVELPNGDVLFSHPIVGYQGPPQRVPARPSEEGRGNRLFVDRRGQFWVGTRGHGLWRVLAPESVEPVIDKASTLSGLSNDGVEALLEDQAGNVWVATTDGLNRLMPHKVEQVLNLGLVTGVESAADGSMWLSTVDAIVEFVGGRPKAPRRVWPLAARLTSMDAAEDGRLWAAIDGRVFRVDHHGVAPVTFHEAHPPTKTTIVASDRQRGVWMYDEVKGLLRWTHGRKPVLACPGISNVSATSLYAERQGRLWMLRSDGRIVMSEPSGECRVVGTGDGLTGGPYHDVLEDRQGTIWLTGDSGFSRFVNGRFATIGAANGIPSGVLTAAIEDEHGTFWIGVVSAGVMRVEREELERSFSDPAHRLAFTFYDRSDGTAGTPLVGSSGAVKSADGRLWFLSGRGASVFDPDALRHEPGPHPALRIESVLADGRPVDVRAGVVLPPPAERLEIDYTTPELTAPLRLQFRYRLEGFDTDWVQAGARRQASYTNLPPGDYRFRVVARRRDGGWDEPGTSWSFAIGPAFYQTTWFFASSTLVLVFGIGGAWRLHLRQVRRRFSLLLGERARLSREIHDTLLQGMVGVALQFDALATDMDSSPARGKERLVRLRKNVEEYIRDARQSIWDLRSPTLEKSDLAAALRTAAEQATSVSGVALEMTVVGTPRPCSAKVKEQLLRIGQEAVMNALHHAHAKEIQLQLVYEPHRILLRVRDDGRGFDATHVFAARDGHYGLVSMKERAEHVGGSLRIASTVGLGTEIEAIVPGVTH